MTISKAKAGAERERVIRPQQTAKTIPKTHIREKEKAESSKDKKDWWTLKRCGRPEDGGDADIKSLLTQVSPYCRAAGPNLTFPEPL